MANRDIFAILKEEHAQISSLFTQLKNTRDPIRRSHRFDDIRGALDVHASSEEQALYPRLESVAATEELAQEAKEAHAEIRECLDILENIDPEEENWDTAVCALERTIRSHVNDEETIIFASLKSGFNERELRQIKKDFLEAKKGRREKLAA